MTKRNISLDIIIIKYVKFIYLNNIKLYLYNNNYTFYTSTSF